MPNLLSISYSTHQSRKHKQQHSLAGSAGAATLTNGKAVCVPPESSRNIMVSLVGIAGHHVFDGPRQDMPVVRQTYKHSEPSVRLCTRQRDFFWFDCGTNHGETCTPTSGERRAIVECVFDPALALLQRSFKALVLFPVAQHFLLLLREVALQRNQLEVSVRLPSALRARRCRQHLLRLGHASRSILFQTLVTRNKELGDQQNEQGLKVLSAVSETSVSVAVHAASHALHRLSDRLRGGADANFSSTDSGCKILREIFCGLFAASEPLRAAAGCPLKI